MAMKRTWILGLIVAFLMVSGCAFADELANNVETQFGLAQKFMEKAGLVGEAVVEPPADDQAARRTAGRRRRSRD